MWQDISRPLTSGMEVYPGDPGFAARRLRQVETDGYALTEISMSAHCGTHMDAPAHLFPDRTALDALPASQFCGSALFGPAALIEMRAPEDLSRVPAGTERLLIHDLGYGGLREADAQRLLAAGVRLIGTNNLSIAAEEVSSAVHTCLLESEVLLLEGLWLEGLSEGAYELIALPLRLVGAEGAPARAFVRAME